MQIIFLQLIVNLLFSKFYKETDWKWFKYSSLVVFPLLTAFTTYLRHFKAVFRSNGPDAISIETATIWQALFFAVISLGLQLVLNDRYEKRKNNVKA